MANSSNRLQSIIEKLGTTRDKMEMEMKNSGDDSKSILHKRAIELAKTKMVPDTQDEYLDVLIFQLADDTYGLPLECIEKVLSWRHCVHLPGAPAHQLGVTEANGEILCIVDSFILLSLPGIANREKEHVLVLGTPDNHWGLLIGNVVGVNTIKQKDINPPPVSLPEKQTTWTKGVTLDGTIILDGRLLLSSMNIEFERDHRIIKPGA